MNFNKAASTELKSVGSPGDQLRSASQAPDLSRAVRSGVEPRFSISPRSVCISEAPTSNSANFKLDEPALRTRIDRPMLTPPLGQTPVRTRVRKPLIPFGLPLRCERQAHAGQRPNKPLSFDGTLSVHAERR